MTNAFFIPNTPALNRAQIISKTSLVALQAKRTIVERDGQCLPGKQTSHRREFLVGGAASLCTGVISASSVLVDSASASGGATAGKYTTIPIAKRRYYGRVQEAVHEFLAMGPDVVKGDMTAESIQNFFDVEGTVVVEGKASTSINGQCTKKDGDCRRKEVRDSRYNDMKASMYLLGNAFRINQQKAPDNLPTVKAAKAFFKDMDEMEKLVKKKPKKNDPEAVARYARALDTLDRYLDVVELPPTDSGHYEQEFDTAVGLTRIM